MILDKRGIESSEKIGEQGRTPQVRMDINLGGMFRDSVRRSKG